MNGTLLHVTQQDVACFVLCVLIKIPCLIGRYFSHVGRAVPAQRIAPERLVLLKSALKED